MLQRAYAMRTGGIRRRHVRIMQEHPCQIRGLFYEHLPTRRRRLRECASLECAGVLSARRSSSTASSGVTFTGPPDDLEEEYFERPTPLLLVAGECQPASWWATTASFFAARGCTVGSMALTGRGSSPTDTLTLRALQAGVASAVDESGLTPPVIVAHSVAGFVCQQYLQSYSASGLVLLDSFPPSPSALANEHLIIARRGDVYHSSGPPTARDDLSLQDLAQVIKDDPTSWEGPLASHFTKLHRSAPWQRLGRPQQGQRIQASPHKECRHSDHSWQPCPGFPAKAFAQMCLGLPSATVRLERHAVETLVLGSKNARGDSNNSLSASVDFGAVEKAKRDVLQAICEFHGSDWWGVVDCDGNVNGPEGATPWHEVVWDWYDARF